MSENINMTTAKDNAGKLFDTIIQSQRLKNDAALARRLEMAPPQLSKIRHGHVAVGPALILRVHERIGMPVTQIRDLIGAVTQ